MTNKFEQLIEYVINDEADKAKELFHDIVVEKSREIYENLMNEEEMDEECSSCHKAHAFVNLKKSQTNPKKKIPKKSQTNLKKS